MLLERYEQLAEALGGGTVQMITNKKIHPSEVPEFLGGLPISEDTHNIPDGHSLSLSRPCPADLPGLHSSDTHFTSATIEEAANKIFQGDIVVQAVEVDTKQAGVIYGISAYDNVRLHGSESDASMHGRQLLTFLFFQNSPGVSATMSIEGTGHFLRGEDMLERQHSALLHRVLHLFLRVAGAELRLGVFFDMIKSLESFYVDHEWWKEALDAAIIRADVVCTNTGHAKGPMANFLFRVGEALECTGSFRKAAILYREIASTFVDLSTTCGYANLDYVYNAEGLAWKRAEDFEASETAYLKAVHACSKTPGGWNQSKVTIDNLFILYEARFDLGLADATVLVTPIVMASLFTVAEISPFLATNEILGEKFRIFGSGVKGKKMACEVLAPEFATKKKARRALLTAISDPENIDAFRSTVNACLNKTFSSGQRSFDIGISSSATKKDEKNAARDFLKDGNEGYTKSSECANCDVLGTYSSFMHCPCRKVLYVSIPFEISSACFIIP